MLTNGNFNYVDSLSGTTDEGLRAGDLPGPDPAWMEKSISLLSSPPGSREDDRAENRAFRMLAGTAEEFDSDLREIATVEVIRRLICQRR